MGYFRLFRRIKIAPGVTINVSKTGLSTSFGPRGAKVTIGRRGVRKTVGIPGTGFYYTSTSSGHRATSPEPSAAPLVPATASPPQGRRGRRFWIMAIATAVILIAILSNLGGNGSDPAPSAPPAALGLIGGTGIPVPLDTGTPTTATAASLAPTTKPAETAKTKATAKPTAKPTPKPTATFVVRITSRTATVSRNSTASVTIKTTANARCSIDVEYASGRSHASGLGDKTASSGGAVSWSWRVGSSTTRGTWPIYITCTLGSRSTEVDTSFTVT